VSRCHTSLVGITKEIRGMKFVYLLEGIAFVTLSLLLVRWLGITGILLAALICNLGITGQYGMNRTAGYFGLSRLVVLGWIIRPASILLLTTALFALTRIPFLVGLTAPFRFCIGVTAFSTLIMPALWMLGMDGRLRHEIRSLAGKAMGKATSRFRNT
jgi:hypothetical protein